MRSERNLNFDDSDYDDKTSEENPIIKQFKRSSTLLNKKISMGHLKSETGSRSPIKSMKKSGMGLSN